MVGKIFINGLIGSIEGESGIELLNIVQQAKSQPNATSFEVYITETPGGVVEVGDDIYNYLVSLDQKTPVTTIAKGLCASISTKIFMAGRNRVIYEGCEFMIHLPMLSADYLNSNELEEATEEMKKLDKDMVEFYSKSTGTEKEAIYPLMRNETYLTAEQAVNLGFATEIKKPVKAVAYLNNSKNKKMTETKLNQEDKSWFATHFESIMKAFSAQGKPVNLILQDENGVEINFPELDDSATPSVGDMATVEGDPAEGSYIMPSLGNVTAVFVAGELTEIIETEEESEELAELRSENEDLKSQLEALNKKEQERDKSLEDLKSQFLNFKKNTSTKFNLDTVTKKPIVEENTPVNSAKSALSKLQEKRKNK